MSVLGLLPSLFQQSDQHKIWQGNDSLDKCSAGNCSSSRSRTKEDHQNVKSQVNLISSGSSKMPSVDEERAADHGKENGQVKKTKKNKKKKGKLSKTSMDNDADQESSVDSAGLPCTQSRSLESCSSGQIGTVHHMNDAESNSICLQSFLRSEESRQPTNSGDAGNSSNIHQLNSDSSVLQDLNISRKKVHKTSKIELAKKQGKMSRAAPSSAAVRLVTELEFVDENLENGRGSESSVSSELTHRHSPNPKSRHMLPRYGNCNSNGASENCSSQTDYGAERRKTTPSKVTADGDDCTTKWNSKDAHTAQSVDLVGQVSRNNCNKEVQYEQFSVMNDTPTFSLSQSVRHEKEYPSNYRHSSRPLHYVIRHKQIEKEKANFVWQRTGRYVEGVGDHQRQISDLDKQRKGSSPDDTTSQPRHNSGVDNELLPVTQCFHTPEHGHTAEKGTCDHAKPITIGCLIADSHECGFQQRFGAEPVHYVRRHGEGGILGNMNHGKPNYKQNQVFKKENVSYNRRESWISKANLSMPSNVHKEATEVLKEGYHCRGNTTGRGSGHGNDHYRSDFSGNHVVECVPSFSVPLSDFELTDPWTEESDCLKHLPETQRHECEPSFSVPLSDIELTEPWTEESDFQKHLPGIRQYNCLPSFSVPLSDFELTEPWTEESDCLEHLSGNQQYECVPSSSIPSSDFELTEPWTVQSDCLNHLPEGPELEPCVGGDNPGAEYIWGQASHLLLDKEDISSARLEDELPHQDVVKECISPRATLANSISIERKDSLVDKTDKGMSEVHQEREIVAVHEAASLTNINSSEQLHGLSYSMKVNCLGEAEEIFSANDNKSERMSYIASDRTLNALDAAYSLQLASERFLLATGRPIADFERFLCRASPVIVPSLLHCDSIIKYQPIQNSINNFQNSEVSLRNVWSWYERHGNYGLDVKAEYSQNERAETEGVSFCAHFVPFLSAVQLIGHSNHSSASTSPENGSTNTSVSSDGNGSCRAVSTVCSSDDLEVIFEYFEHEPPQQRKPLYAKVKDLMKIGTSSPQVFGDVSMLECTKLQDLHPASWYSVAWYPIYRIPEGSFRASFLTYHSLGRLVPRNITKEENAFCAVSPVVGMQSYNAQVEHWFHHNQTESDIKDSLPLDSSELLAKRLKILERNAALLARGHVRKDHISVQNRHPDYEFYLTRR